MVVIFLGNRCTIAIIFIQIMDDVPTIYKVLHYDLSFTNILFYFGEMDDKGKIYIGISNWELTTISLDKQKSNHFLHS